MCRQVIFNSMLKRVAYGTDTLAASMHICTYTGCPDKNSITLGYQKSDHCILGMLHYVIYPWSAQPTIILPYYNDYDAVIHGATSMCHSLQLSHF